MKDNIPEKPHYWGHRKRIRDGFLKSGFRGFADYEIVELLLTLAILRSDVKEPANALIAKFGNLRGILDASIEELQEIKGSGSVSPVTQKIIKEAVTLYLQQSSEGKDCPAEPDILSEFWRMIVGTLKNEMFEVGYLDSGYRLLRDGIDRLEEGTLDQTAVFSLRLVESALRKSTYVIVLTTSVPAGVLNLATWTKSLRKLLSMELSQFRLMLLIISSSLQMRYLVLGRQDCYDGRI